MWGATADHKKKKPTKKISIHAPMWGATRLHYNMGVYINISIHAPMWGATLVPGFLSSMKRISIHAPMWGATVSVHQSIIGFLFQSTHPCGVRRIFVSIILGKILISIHAPMWGATCFNCKVSRHQLHFNPRTHVGCDLQCQMLLPFS